MSGLVAYRSSYKLTDLGWQRVFIAMRVFIALIPLLLVEPKADQQYS